MESFLMKYVEHCYMKIPPSVNNLLLSIGSSLGSYEQERYPPTKDDFKDGNLF